MEIVFIGRDDDGYDDIYKPEVKTYPDGTPIIAWSEGIPDKDVDSILVRPNSIGDFVAAMFLVDAWVERGNSIPRLLIPNVPGARQDRLNDSGDYLFTAKSVARMINDRNFPEVVVVDPHSEVISGLIDRCHVVHSDWVLLNHRPFGMKWDAVIAPDAGAEKRANAVAKALQIPVVIHAGKTRDVTNGKITGFWLQDIADEGVERVLVVDDICDGGGTFLGLADEIDKAGYEADLYVTHGIFSQGTKALNERYTEVICTDSIVKSRENVSVLPISLYL